MIRHSFSAELTTESPVSHYGIPVLRITSISHDGSTETFDLSPSDPLPSPSPWTVEKIPSAAEFVRLSVLGQWPWEDTELNTAVEKARLFCSQWPEGPQIP